jgi:D-3-phosphoglycerate dehydrogenase
VAYVASDREEIWRRIPEFDAYFASLAVRMDREMLEHATRLRVIASAATGRDHIDLDCAAERGIAILSLKDDTEFLSNITATAELAWGLLLATIRHLPWAFAAAKAGQWRTGGRYRGHQLSGKTLGILGYGRLGRILAQYGKAFRMRVLACDIRDVTPEEGVTMVDFDTLLRESDVLSIHIHLQGNEGLISKDAFDKMKPGAVLVNTSRGGIIDETAFIAALESGRLAGAGVDVITGEWDPDLSQHPLIRYANTHENLVISPHIGGVTFESQRMALEYTARKLKAHLQALA